MEWEYKVAIDLGFDCTPPESSSKTPWDIADEAVDKVNVFIAGEPIGSEANERFDSKTSKLYVRIEIPITTVSAAGTLLTKLKNGISVFPPVLPDAIPKYNFMAHAFEPAGEVPDEG